jgi:uncharacterized membrane protein
MQRVALVSSAVLIVAMFALSAWAWTVLPSDTLIPVHWGINGQPDRYGGKGEALLLTPLMAVVLTGVLAVIPRFEPRRQNFAASSGAFATIWIAIIAFFGVVHVVLVSAALGRSVDVLAVFPIAIGVLFVVIGAQLSRTRSNFFMGIRTPWTLSSEESWTRTHRVGSYLFIGLGLLLAVAGILRSERMLLVVLVIGLPVEIIALFVYSYLVWRNDPNKQTSREKPI